MANFYRRRGKRVLDVIGASAIMLVASPVAAAAAVGVRVDLGAPILFRQSRTGLHGCPFTLLKFRTMKEESNTDSCALPDSQRVTAWGRFLRGTSVDELPQLWNVLRGDMSLVGPRPLLPQYLDFYTDEQRRRHLVRPGLTGLAQVTGRNATTWDQRLALDCRYVDEFSLRLDIKILIQTIHVVLKRSGNTNPDLQPFDVTKRWENHVA